MGRAGRARTKRVSVGTLNIRVGRGGRSRVGLSTPLPHIRPVQALSSHQKTHTCNILWYYTRGTRGEYDSLQSTERNSFVCGWEVGESAGRVVVGGCRLGRGSGVRTAARVRTKSDISAFIITKEWRSCIGMHTDTYFSIVQSGYPLT